MAYNRPFMQNQMNFNPANQQSQGSRPSLMHHNNNVNVPFMMNNSFNPNIPTPSSQHMPYQNFPNAPSPCVSMMNRMQFEGQPSNPMYGPPRILEYSNPPIRNQTPNFDFNLHLQHRGMMMYHPRNHQMLHRPPPNFPNEFRKLDFAQQGNQPNTFKNNRGQPWQAIGGAATPQTVETGAKNDSITVANFLKNRGKPEKSWKKPGQTDLKISHAHHLQTRANILRQKLKTLNQEKHTSEIKKLKVELDTILEKLSDEDFIQK
uniref:Uncharacterized protein n=1 Tax=Ciona savignyi TaxID=51511 RepID=H2ZFM8_CIOSA